jgi:hypothetical protein
VAKTPAGRRFDLKYKLTKSLPKILNAQDMMRLLDSSART